MKIGFIDYFLDEWHANNYPAFLKKADAGMEVVCAYGEITSPHEGGRTSEAWCRDMGVAHCETIEAVIERSDALVVLAPDNSEVHERLCDLPLRSGKPTFVDKTFTPDGDTARRLFMLADQHNTPCYSSSALRYAAEYQDLPALGVQAIASWGEGALHDYGIHQLEPIMMLMKTPAARVQYLPRGDWYTLCAEFADGRMATVTGVPHGIPFMLNCTGRKESRIVTAESDFFAVFSRKLAEFFRTEEPPVAYTETVWIMDILGAGMRAKETPGVWVKV